VAVRVALVGAGGIGEYHLNQLKKMRDRDSDSVEVVGVADVVQARAADLAAKAGCRAYTSHIEMYERERPQAVLVGIPPFAHTDQETAAAERGIHVFVQKPPALTLEKAREVAAVIARTGIITAVGFQDRYLDVVQEARRTLEGEPVGLAMGYWIGGLPGSPWWRVRAQSGGQAVEQTIHIFDTARYLFGEAESVHATVTSGLLRDVPNYDVDDASAMTVKFRNGVVCTIFSACFLRGAPGKAGLDVYGQRVRVEYALRASVRISREGEVRELRHRNDNDLECVRTFVDAVRLGDPSAIRSPYADAVKSLELPLAGHRAAESGQRAPVTG
jgi:myo-inositol 2-dehydrogenase/D-chiro-inositol 1-dehydrogenase